MLVVYSTIYIYVLLYIIFNRILFYVLLYIGLQSVRSFYERNYQLVIVNLMYETIHKINNFEQEGKKIRFLSFKQELNDMERTRNLESKF